ncbi:MAG: hypothetical protein DLM70_18590 [Chloroflexi bacterium]|nr:MAG: hypothetical protein DLM70_18590 [Chloroflexota bacterium]
MSANRRRHTSPEVEEAIRDAENLGWRVELRSGHAWGLLLCPLRSRGGCRMSVSSTPANAGNEARRIRSRVARCTHGGGNAGK